MGYIILFFLVVWIIKAWVENHGLTPPTSSPERGPVFRRLQADRLTDSRAQEPRRIHIQTVELSRVPRPFVARPNLEEELLKKALQAVGTLDALTHTPLEAGDAVLLCGVSERCCGRAFPAALAGELGGLCPLCGSREALAPLVLPRSERSGPALLPAPPLLLTGGRRDRSSVHVSPESMQDYVGTEVILEGRVKETYASPQGNWFLNFGSYPMTFPQVVIFRPHVESFRRAGWRLLRLRGRLISVRGRVHRHPYWGVRMQPSRSTQIKLLHEGSSGFYLP